VPTQRFGKSPSRASLRSTDVTYGALVHPLRLFGIAVIRIVRWWFGLTYLVVGAGGCLAGPIMIGFGNYGGIYMIVGGPMLAAMGWVVHPWGLQRAMNGLPLLPVRR